ncbi:MAG: hypothetical protein WAQ24_02390 [Candidatus Saccharimonadales bacterium]
MAAEAVFNGVYQSFADYAQGRPTARKQFIDGKETIVTVNPALEFVQDRFDEAGKSIETLASQSMRPSDISNKFMSEATTEAMSVYDGNRMAVGTRVERAGRVVAGFIDRASKMFEDGEIDGLTLKVFFDRIQGFKYSLSLGYNNLVTKSDESMPDEETKTRYAQAIHDTFIGKPNVEGQENGAFLHVNGQSYLASGSSTNERYYISPKLNGQPEKVVKTWVETLDSLGLGDKLYYKVAEGLSHRYDALIAYASPDTASDMEKAVQEFARRCPQELLSDSVIPTGVEVAKGIARAPEPHGLNTLLRYCGKETVSYNEFACALTELSLRRASHDFIEQGIQPEQVTPKALSEAAKPYFMQFVKLSGLDPVTMKVA